MEPDRASIPQTNCKWPNPKGFEPIGASQETILYLIYGYAIPKRPCWSLISFRRGYLIAPVQFLTVGPSDLGPEAVHEDFWLQALLAAGAIVSFLGFHLLDPFFGYWLPNVGKQELTLNMKRNA